jgi:acetyl-CoA decarbonylase/synthase complex subunit beta
MNGMSFQERLKRFPVEIGEMYEGERIRRPDMYVEFGGTDVQKKFELVLVRPLEEVEDGRILVVGPDLPEMKVGGSYPIGILIEAAGKRVDKDIEGVLERRLHYFMNYIEGVMHLNQRADVWIRISKRSYQKGLNSLKLVGEGLMILYKSSLPIVEKIQMTFYTDPAKIEEVLPKALEVYAARDARARTLKDEDVEEFYGCVMCQSFAPTHMCVITPNRIASCGSISWFDARAASNVDPKGPNFPVPKGNCLDPVKGVYEGVNKTIKEKTMGSVKQISLYSMFDHPHTSCGCFEAIAFYIPEVDGAGIIHRDFKGPGVNGLPFSTMAGHTSGGTQNEGFCGIAIEYTRSSKFLQADGGWSRIVWVPSQVKERVKDAIPPDLVDRIATENDAKTVSELKEFLKQKGHPVVERWKEEAELGKEEAKEGELVAPAEAEELAPAILQPTVELPAAAGFRIILKNAKITAEKVIIKRAEKVK